MALKNWKYDSKGWYNKHLSTQILIGQVSSFKVNPRTMKMIGKAKNSYEVIIWHIKTQFKMPAGKIFKHRAKAFKFAKSYMRSH